MRLNIVEIVIITEVKCLSVSVYSEKNGAIVAVGITVSIIITFKVNLSIYLKSFKIIKHVIIAKICEKISLVKTLININLLFKISNLKFNSKPIVKRINGIVKFAKLIIKVSKTIGSFNFNKFADIPNIELIIGIDAFISIVLKKTFFEIPL